MIGHALFALRYGIYINLQKLIQPRRREYIMFILGLYPDNFKEGITSVVDANSYLRYSIGGSCVAVRFDSTQKIRQIENTFNRIFSGHIENYFLFEAQDATTAKGLNAVVYKHLYDDTYNKIPLLESIDRIEGFFTVINNMRRGMVNYIKEQVNEIEDDEALYSPKKTDNIISMDDINPILDKIRVQGIESLTEEEKQILNKYAHND